MSLAPGTRLGSYDIQTLLGTGGMGQVYRARDVKLARDVAIKTLPELFAGDPERVARFEREAQMLAALNHPHIGGIYGFEEADGQRFLVLELVDGQSLADRIAIGGQLPVPEAIGIARQMAGALEAAHEKGIIHRDLKPGNVMLTADGDVKVLDFGLARSVEEPSGASAVNSPTLTFAGTELGIILGTAAYMSPEQAKGRVADKRSDVWSFGCVLFEMLTGKRAFDGEDVSDTLAAVLRGEPDWSALPPGVPAHLQTLLKRCLQRDRKARIPDISVVRYAIDDATAPQTPSEPLPAPPSKPSRARVLTVSAIALLAGIGLTAGGVWAVRRWTPEPPLQLIRFSIVPPEAQPLYMHPADRVIAMSPDGSHVLYTGGNVNAPTLNVRALDRLDVTTLTGITLFRDPFFSADGRWIGYFTSGELRKVPVAGGPSIPVCRTSSGPRGAAWLPDDTIVFATNDPATGLLRVPAAGGEPKTISTPDTANGELDHVFPSALPDGRAVLFTITVPGSPANAHVAVLELATGERRRLISGGSQPEYLAGGSLIYAIEGTLRAVRFDPDRRRVLSGPVPVLQGLSTLGGTGAANYAVSRQGHLVYVPASEGTRLRSLVWVDRHGREEAIDAPPRGYGLARLSPDNQRIAVDIRDHGDDIWLLDLAHRTPPSRLTFDVVPDRSPLWTRDGRQIIFQSVRGSTWNLFSQAADHTGEAIRLTTSPNAQAPNAITGDGRLVFTELRPLTGPDLLAMTLDGKGPADTLVETSVADGDGDLSPDGRWLAYQSAESGPIEIYVKPFPNVTTGRWQLSTGGGSRPAWSPAGGELFYLSPSGAMMSVTVQTTPAFSVGTPTKLFEAPYFMEAQQRTYDVSRDGKRFLMVKNAPGTEGSASPGLVVVTNWSENVKAALK